MAAVNDADPVIARRRRIARAVRAGKRAGYLALLVAIVAFFAAAATSFPGPLVTTIVIALVASCLTLPPAIVFGYAVRAAEREESQR